jgi:hypothetical protein
MILKNETPLPDYYGVKEISRYAVFPTRMKRFPNDKMGKIIWLEKYVKLYRFDRKSKRNWDFESSLTLNDHFLNKLADENKAQDSEQDMQKSMAGLRQSGQLATCINSLPSHVIPIPYPPILKKYKN